MKRSDCSRFDWLPFKDHKRTTLPCNHAMRWISRADVLLEVMVATKRFRAVAAGAARNATLVGTDWRRRIDSFDRRGVESHLGECAPHVRV